MPGTWRRELFGRVWLIKIVRSIFTSQNERRLHEAGFDRVVMMTTQTIGRSLLATVLFFGNVLAQDGAALVENALVNVLNNGTFETGTAGWTFYTNGAGSSSTVAPGAAGSSRALQLAITTAGTNVQLFQSGITLQPNTSYKLSFDAWSNTAHDLDVSLQKHVSPFTSYGLTARKFDLSSGWRSYTVTFTTANFSASVSDARLMFRLALYDANGDRYYLDNIVLEKSSVVAPVPPAITLQPLNQTAAAGQTATFVIAATGTAPLMYQWLRDEANIVGATGSSYTTPPLTSADNGASFRCRVVNSAGTVTSSKAVLQITTPLPPIVTADPRDTTLKEGQSARFIVAATGTAPLGYQWQKNGSPLPGAVTASYTTSPAVLNDDGAAFRCIVSNAAGADTSSPAILTVLQNSGPVVDLWYGTDQTAGRIGTPQRWMNILGNVSDPNGVKTLTYRLNGGSPVTLSIGANRRRLVRKGDFNIDLPMSALQAGQNTVAVTATDSIGASSSTSIRVTKVAGTVWPLTYDVAWSSASSLQDSAQVVDGKWGVVPGGIRPLERGYDRLVGLGDTAWTDYEVTALVTVHAIDSTRTAYDSVNAAPNLGIILRWNGHTTTPISYPPYDQPKTGYLPLGSIGCYTWRNGFGNGRTNRWEMLGNDNLALKDQNSAVPLPYGVAHYFKMRVTTVAGVGGLYRFKAWPATQPEPSTWMLTGQENLTGPQRGGFLLAAHHVDVTIGSVMVRPLDATPPALSNIAAAADTIAATISWTTNEPASSKVLYGLTGTYSDSVDNAAEVLSHTVRVTGLMRGRLYHYKVVSRDRAGNSTSSADLTFSTSSGAPLGFRSDDFHDGALDNSLWTFVNPRSDAQLAFVGTGTADVRLSLAVPAGVSHDVWTTNNAPRIMQHAANTDFELEVKFDAPLTAQYQMEGVLVQQDNANFLRFDFIRDNTFGMRLFVASFTNGSASVRVNTPVPQSAPVYLRVRRQGHVWTPLYSYNGTNWTAGASIQPRPDCHHGRAFIGNHGVPESASPAFLRP